MSELRFRGVSVRFGAMQALDHVDLVVGSGRVVGLVGESGSGKSTLARAAVRLVPTSSGQITIDGHHTKKGWGGGTPGLQLVFQDPYSSLDPTMTVGRIVAEGIAGRPGRTAVRAEVTRLLELVRLDPVLASSRPAQLSGGQRQRVALARALGTKPKVLIADEITSALDVSVQGAVLNLVRSLVDELGLSMLFISHNLAVVRQISDDIAVMYLGKIVEFGPVDEVTRSPEHPYTRSLLESTPRFGAPLGAGTDDPAVAAVRDVDPPNPHRPPSGCHFHTRCPVGPAINSERQVCTTTPPQAAGRRHQAACHFAELANQGQTVLDTGEAS